MTGGSLGLRTASYGSLQQNTCVLPLHISPTVIIRKPTKMLLSNSREKEKILPRIFKYMGRRSFGMSILAVISVLVCLSLLFGIFRVEVLLETSLFYSSYPTYLLHVSINEYNHTAHLQRQKSQHIGGLTPIKYDDATDGVDPSQNIVIHKGNITNDIMSPNEPEKSPSIWGQDEIKNTDESSGFQNVTGVMDRNKIPLSPPAVIGNVLPPVHPCSNFSLPPPPANRKRTGPRPCPVCYVPVEQAMLRMPSAPSTSPVLMNLTYVHEENPVRTEPFGGSDFGGYPSLKQRNDSFHIKESMNVHCGFVRGSKPGHQTGFDIDDTDLLEMEQCHGIVVASAIFGNYDAMQQPKNISEAAKKNVCFYMFVDEETEAYMKNSSGLDERRKIGIWRVVVVHNLPYVDARRNGKVPKLLLHRIFPNARYSIWVDGKLELIVDPYQILERFLWRSSASFAISRHYKRFDVFEEAEANKAAGKYENASIDFQIEFYKKEGLTPYTEAKLPITSDVPEGCVIIKEHIPITNLFTCLWFNEVDRFTSRDQISFSTVRDKIMSKVNWNVNMFLDCERRNFVVQAYHRDLLEQMTHMAPPLPVAASIHRIPSLSDERPQKSSPSNVTERVIRNPMKKVPPKRGRERRSGSRRHRKTYAGNRETNSI